MQHDFILLDRSGSMQNIWTEALGAINNYVKKLADDNVDTGVTLMTFDSDEMTSGYHFDVIRDRITPKTWRPVSNVDAEPRGFTPLSDGTGRIVNLANAGNYDKVAIIIMTDGHENSSKELTVEKTKSLLGACRAKNWQVVMLGADFNNAAQARSYGNAAASTATMGMGKMSAATSMLASKRSVYGATGQSVGFSDEEKKEIE